MSRGVARAGADTGQATVGHEFVKARHINS